MNITDIINLFILLILSLIQKKSFNNIANALKNSGIIDGIIKILQKTKIHVQVITNIFDLISTTIQNRFEILDEEQVINNKLIIF